MKKLISLIALPVVLLFGNAGAWGYMIVGGPDDGQEVGALDLLRGEQAGPFTGGDGNPGGEEAWAEDILGVDLTFSGKTGTVNIYDTDTANIRAFSLSFEPGYFIVKNATYRALYENLADTNWGVIDIGALDPGFNLGGTTISHVTEFDEKGEPDQPVPLPGTVALLGLGILAFGWTRRRKLVA